MSSHVWLRKPTPAAADILVKAFDYAVHRTYPHNMGILLPYPQQMLTFEKYVGNIKERYRQTILAPYQRKVWAGYFRECVSQSGPGRGCMADYYWRATAGGFKFLRGRNVANYALDFDNHLPLILLPYYERANLTTDTPWQVLADWYTDHDLADDAQKIRYYHATATS